jgi:hypothetical protein
MVYTVAGERFASPLTSLREIANNPTEAAKQIIIEGHSVQVRSLAGVLGLSDPSQPPDGEAVLVVALPSMWFGFLVESVQGMLHGAQIHHVSDGLSLLPSHTIIGAVILDASTRFTGRGLEHTPAPVSGAKTRDGDEDADAEIVLVLDLVNLASFVQFTARREPLAEFART